MSTPILEVVGLQKHFGDLAVLRGIDFSVQTGDVICIIGSSGSGKSTLLRCINFLEQPDGGEIRYHGKNAETGWKRTEYCARVGMVFQSFNLFGNLSVLDNCVLGQMQVLHRRRAESEERALHYLERVGMAAYRILRGLTADSSRKARVSSPCRMLCPNPSGTSTELSRAIASSSFMLSVSISFIIRTSFCFSRPCGQGSTELSC